MSEIVLVSFTGGQELGEFDCGNSELDVRLQRHALANPTEMAIAQARHDLGPEQADPLWARVEAMSYDELVEYLGVEFDLAIAST